MMLFPEEILDTQICSSCKQYLSYGPIKLSILEGVKCGRCSKDTEPVSSLVNNIIENVIFPCVNRFDGCNKLLKCEDVPQHENICKGSLFSCPICINQSNKQVLEYTFLSLIHHYQIFHNKYYLTKPLLSFDTNSAKEYNFLYCDKYKNILAFINVKINAGQPFVKIVALGNIKDKIVCNLNCHAARGNVIVARRSTSAPSGESYFELSATNSDNSSDKMCLELEFSFLHVTTSSISFEESKIKYSSLIEKKIKPEDLKYCGEPYDDFMLKCMPDVTPSMYIRRGVRGVKKIQKKSVWGKTYVLKYSSRDYNITCNLCENYFFSSGYIYQKFTMCQKCYKICSNFDDAQCHNPLNMLFFCRYQCGTSILDDAVFDHEKACSNNPKAAFSDSQFAKFYFGNYFIDSSNEFKSIVIRNNNRIVFEKKYYGTLGRIYMVTDSRFCCIIFYKSDKSDIHFSVAHKYPLDKYYTLFKIVDDENEPFLREEKNCFKVSLQTRKLFLVVAPREYTDENTASEVLPAL